MSRELSPRGQKKWKFCCSYFLSVYSSKGDAKYFPYVQQLLCLKKSCMPPTIFVCCVFANSSHQDLSSSGEIRRKEVVIWKIFFFPLLSTFPPNSVARLEKVGCRYRTPIPCFVRCVWCIVWCNSYFSSLSSLWEFFERFTSSPSFLHLLSPLPPS